MLFLSLLALIAFHATLNAELIFAQVWFRHGARAPTVFLRFPSEPVDYGAEFPYEKGELTKEGKMMEYQLGQRLREEFKGFISDRYLPHQNMIYIDEDNRTSDSAALMLAGLYPPSDSEIWNPQLLWNPIALHQDNILVKAGMGISYNCPKIGEQVAMRQSFWDILKTSPKMNEELEKATGVKITVPKNLSDILDEYWTRYTLQDPRLPIPQWLDDKMGSAIRLIQDNITTQFFRIPEVMNSIGAWHSTRILAEIDFVLNQAPDKRRKFVFFSGHDTNLLITGIRLGLPGCGEHFCDYGGSLAIELHNQSNTLYLKFFYSHYYNLPREEVFSKKCGNQCTLARFRELFSEPRIDETTFWNECKYSTIENGNDHTILLVTMLMIIVGLVLTNAATCVKLVKTGKRRGNTFHLDDEREPLMLKEEI